MKKILICLILIYALLLLACPKSSAVRNAAKASFELSGLTRDAIAATGKAYAQNLISLETKDKLADRLKLLSIGGQRYNQALEAAIKIGDIPPDKLQMLSVLFSNEVVTPFLEILQLAKAISPETAANLRAAINALQSAILIISGGFSALNIKSIRRIESYV